MSVDNVDKIIQEMAKVFMEINYQLEVKDQPIDQDYPNLEIIKLNNNKLQRCLANLKGLLREDNVTDTNR